MGKYRTHTCGELRPADDGKAVTLSGWVNRRRDHGNLIFIDIRDRYGVTQVVFNPATHVDAHTIAETLRPEFVVCIHGTVMQRPTEMVNDKIATGGIEIDASAVEILNKAKTPPFEIAEERDVNEEMRLTYRYLDLRRSRVQRNIVTRHQAVQVIRNYFDEQGFIDVETPILVKGTPEGSREYLVPSRLHAGKFYVLPQSPQQLKQLLMVAGFDKYFQVPRCFRDEDQRGDRQPEFTQFEIEMSFVEQDDVLAVMEELFVRLSKQFMADRTIAQLPFPRISWYDAMSKYGSDKPDLRFDLSFVNLTESFATSGFQVFQKAVASGGVIMALRVPGGAVLSRGQIDALTDMAKTAGAGGLAYIMWKDGAAVSPILKFLSPEELQSIEQITGATNGDAVFFGAGAFRIACESLGAVRLGVADLLKLRDESLLAYTWVVDFPLFERSKETGDLVSSHHPFTRPHPDDAALLATEPEKVRAVAHDIVLNDVEIGGGSMRIHERDIQAQIFRLLGVSDEDADRRFGHMLRAFEYGAPPHGGMACGLDRVIMLMCGEPNIREVIAFPKNQSAQDLMLDAPSAMPAEQVREANVQIIEKTE